MTSTDPEEWPEVLDLMEARKRSFDRYLADLAGKPDTAAAVTEKYLEDDAVYSRRIEEMCAGREDLATLAQLWNASNGYGVDPPGRSADR